MIAIHLVVGCAHARVDLVETEGGTVIGQHCRTCLAVLQRGRCGFCGADLWLTEFQVAVGKRYCGLGCRQRAYRQRLKRALLAAVTSNGDLLYAA